MIETEVAGVRIAELEPEGPLLDREAVINDIIGELLWSGADIAVIPTSRLGEEFLRLSTGLAGAVTQKFVNYHMRLAIVGDISAELERSSALRDYVREVNAGRHVLFASDRADLARRLGAS